MVTGTAALVLLGIVGVKFTDFSKYLKARDWNGVYTQLYAWGASIGLLFLFANSGLADNLVLPFSDVPLDQYSAGALTLVGLAPGSLGSFLVDYKKSVDNTQSAITPSLFE